MLTLTLVASLLACSAATAWNNDPWPAASQARPAAGPVNSDPWPAANQARPAAAQASYTNPDDFWWNDSSNNPFDNAAAHPSRSRGSPARAPASYQGASSAGRRQQAGSPSYQAPRPAAPGRAIVSVSTSGVPRVTGVRRVSSGVAQGAASVASVSGQYVPPGAGSQSRPQQVFRGSVSSASAGRQPSRQQSFVSSASAGRQPSRQQSFVSSASAGRQPSRQQSFVSSASAGRQPSRHQSSVSSVSVSGSGSGSGSFAQHGSRGSGSGSFSSGQYVAPGSGSHSSVSSVGQRVVNRPQPARFNSGQYTAPNSGSNGQYSGSNSGQYSGSSSGQNSGQYSGSNSGQNSGQYSGSASGGSGSSVGAQSPVVKACGASLFCVDTSTCDPYTGFLMDPSQGPIPQLDQPTVAFTRCYMTKSRSVGVCCQEPHINDPWTDRTTNGR